MKKRKNDLNVLKVVGFSSCPSDAIKENKEIVRYVCKSWGGEGCVREFVEEVILTGIKKDCSERQLGKSLKGWFPNQQIGKSMRNIEDLRDRHKGKEIWVLGCGLSLDDFPSNFFENKISIAINFAVVAFPHSTYWIASHPEVVAALAAYNSKMLKRAICTYPYVPTMGNRPLPKQSLKLLNSHKNEIIWFRWNYIVGNKKKFLQLYRGTVNSIMAKKPCHLTCFSTIAHYAIEIAAILGSRKITLAGCEAAAQGKKWHAEGRGIRKFIEQLLGPQYLLLQKRHIMKFSRFRQGTQALTLVFKSHGVIIQRYFYGSGYRSII